MIVYRVRLAGDERDVTVNAEDGALRVSSGGRTCRVEFAEVAPEWYSLVVDGGPHGLGARRSPGRPGDGAARDAAGHRRWTIVLDGEAHDVEVVPSASPRAARRAAEGRGPASREVRAPMPGLLLAVRVAEGAEVVAGQPLAVMEAMKMQMEIRSTAAGVVRRVHAGPGAQIRDGQVLVTIE